MEKYITQIDKEIQSNDMYYIVQDLTQAVI